MNFRLVARKSYDGIRSWLQRAGWERELSALPDHLLKDMGVDRSEIPVVAHNHSKPSRLLERMLARIGINPKLARRQFPELMRAVRQRCGVCGARWSCRHWLDFDEPRGGYRLFCPNAARLDVIRNSQSGQPEKASIRADSAAPGTGSNPIREKIGFPGV